MGEMEEIALFSRLALEHWRAGRLGAMRQCIENIIVLSPRTQAVDDALATILGDGDGED